MFRLTYVQSDCSRRSLDITASVLNERDRGRVNGVIYKVMQMSNLFYVYYLVNKLRQILSYIDVTLKCIVIILTVDNDVSI